ncbi:MAG: hypothetical protein B7Z71_13155 [Acidocella sp. 21-58-7]|nr:MAG: hypothetical protein B7Z71_13155 [Acidocella sp. 21-58-7]
MEEEQEHDGAGDPAQAFEALRAEVAVLRHAIEAAAERQAPDYSPDLGRITQAVNGLIDGLEAIAAHPAVRMTPDQFGQAMTRTGRELMNEVAQKYDRARQDAERERHQLAGMIGTLRGKDAQRNWVLTAGAGGLLAGVLLYVSLVSFLPTSAGAWLAAFPLTGGDRWGAGWTLIRAANPREGETAAYGFNLVQANQATLAACQAVTLKPEKDRRCDIKLNDF